MTIIFKNKGLIDLAAVTTLGVSVKGAGAFGRFGTGLKFSISTILRGGGRIELWIGGKRHLLASRKKVIQGQPFDVVTLNGKALGFTTQLGCDWQPWMVLRELACNAMDEGGEFWQAPDDCIPSSFNAPDETLILVWWDKLEEAYGTRDELFVTGEVLASTPQLRILAGPSDFVYYRGVRVRKLEKPTAFKYDILEQQHLTEDRTLPTMWYADGFIRRAFLTSEDSSLIAGGICAGAKFYEHTLDFSTESVECSKTFLDEVLNARDRRDDELNRSAVQVVIKTTRKSSDERATYVSNRRVEDNFSRALDVIEEAGLKISSDTQYIVVQELEGDGVQSLAQDGRVYVLRDLLRQPVRVIAGEIIRRHIDLHLYSTDDVADFFIPALLKLAGLPEPMSKDSRAGEEEQLQVETAVALGFDEETMPGGVRDPAIEEMVPF